MTKILIDEATVRQALKALERMKGYGDVFLYRSHEQKPYDQVCDAATALRQVLATQLIEQQAQRSKMADNARGLGLSYEQPIPSTMKQAIIEEASIQMTGHPSKDARLFAKSVYEYLMAEQPAQQGVLARKWVLHGGFADVASFDAEGFPSFYWKESVAKFKAGELSTPCKGKNCGSLNGWLHSAECRAEHEAHYAVTKGNT